MENRIYKEMRIFRSKLFINDLSRNNKTPQGRLCLAILLLALFNSCISYSSMSVEKGKAIDQEAIKQIVIGSSTRSDVFELLGTPHSIFEGQTEFEESQAFLHGGGAHHRSVFYSYKDKRQLKTINESHYAMLYQFSTSSSNSTGLYSIVISYQKSDFVIKSSELLLFLHKKTSIVEDVAYRKEISEP